MNNPSEIARETLRQLALKRIPPTPDNYRRLYSEIGGGRLPEVFPAQQLQQLRSALEAGGAKNPEIRPLVDAIEAQDWARTQDSLLTLIDPAGTGGWQDIVPQLLREWERPQAGLTPAQKRAAIDRAITRGGTGSKLRDEIRELIKKWTTAPTRTANSAEEAAPSSRAGSAPEPADGMNLIRDLCAQLLRISTETISGKDSAISVEAEKLAERLLAAKGPGDFSVVAADLKRFVFRLTLAGDDSSDLNLAVLQLLQLLVDNVGELIIDDQWLHGQIAVVKDLIAAPRNLRAIEDAERRLRDVIIQQSTLKASLLEARDAMKEMLSGFVQRLAHFADDTSHYHDKIEVCARKISAASDIRDLNEVLREVMQETRAIQLTAQRSRDELREARQRVTDAEKRIHQLQDELGKTSDLVRHDQLTGALNRRGLEEAFEREIARSARHDTPICLAVLDIDDFKKLNDSLGHQAGDAALVHLTEVIRSAVRPQDTVARYGGEEFVIIMPDTVLEDAREALVRLQRTLTKRFFLHDNQRLLITFSAGVTQLATGCSRDEAIKRADELMYEAKRAGKNRVIGA